MSEVAIRRYPWTWTDERFAGIEVGPGRDPLGWPVTADQTIRRWYSAHAGYSQFGEDDAIIGLLVKVGTVSSAAFEFGAYDGVHLSNVRALWEQGFDVYLIEGDERLYRRIVERGEENCHAVCAMVTPENVDDLLLGMGCPAEPDVGVIDIDGQDYWVLDGMRRVRPRVLMVECSRDERHDFVPERDAPGQATWRPLLTLAESMGYTLVGRNPINLLFVRSDVLGDLR